MSYKLAIFDLDGTLLNTLEDLTDATNYALKTYNFPIRTIDEVRRFVGNGIMKLIERAVPTETDSITINSVFNCFCEFYKDHSAVKTAPYQGIIEILDELKSKGCKLAVLSNKADFAVQTLISNYFPGRFDFIAGEREGIRKKPAPDAVYEALKSLGIEKDDSVYIGDSEVDIATADNAAIDCISVTWGFREKSLLQSLSHGVVIDNPADLINNIL